MGAAGAGYYQRSHLHSCSIKLNIKAETHNDIGGVEEGELENDYLPGFIQTPLQIFPKPFQGSITKFLRPRGTLLLTF